MWKASWCFHQLLHIPKKNRCVILQSSLHNRNDVTNDIDKKPRIILNYNKTKGGVDSVDKKIACYTCKRKTIRYSVVVFSNILDISINNAFVLFIRVFPDWNPAKYYRRRLLIETLAESLIKGHIDRRQQLQRFINFDSKVSMATSANKLLLHYYIIILLYYYIIILFISNN